MKSREAGASQRDVPNVKVILSTLWVFAMFNYLYADVVALMNPEVLKQFMTGSIGSLHITEGFLLGAAILMETAMAMVVLSRVLRYRAGRPLNIVIGLLHTVAVLASMFVGTPALYSIFFAVVEVPCTLFIVWYAWRWKEEGASVKGQLSMEAISG